MLIAKHPAVEHSLFAFLTFELAVLEFADENGGENGGNSVGGLFLNTRQRQLLMLNAQKQSL